MLTTGGQYFLTYQFGLTELAFDLVIRTKCKTPVVPNCFVLAVN